MRKKLLIFQTHPIQYFAPLYRLLSARGKVDVVISYLSDAGAVAHFDPGFGVEVTWDSNLLAGYRVRVARPGSAITDKGFFGRRVTGLEAILTSERPDWVYIYGYSSLANWQVMVRCKMSGIRILYSADSNARIVKSRLKNAFKQLPVRLFFSQIDRFLFCADANRDYLLGFGVDESRMTHSPFAIDVDFFSRSASVASERRHVDFAWIGKLQPRKRVLDFIEALQRLRACGCRFRALLGGDGPDMELIRARAANLVEEGSLELAGFMNQAQVAKALGRSEAFVMTSDSEPYGLVVTEACASGCAIIATSRSGCVGASGSARAGENALAYAAGDVDALYEAMSLLLLDHDLRASMQDASRQIAPQHALEVAVSRIEAVVLDS